MEPGPSRNMGSNVGDANGGMSAGCSKFPSYTTSNQNGIFAMDQTSPPSTTPVNNSAFPSPPSTSTGSQPNISTNLSSVGRSQPPQSKSANVKPSVQTATNAANRSSSGNFFNFLFRGRKSDSQHNIQNFISNEGSITANGNLLLVLMLKLQLHKTFACSMADDEQTGVHEGPASDTRDSVHDLPAA